MIAPDLPGHGDSAAPPGDYSLGAHAAALRNLLVALGHPSATVVGHSLGGGIAMQFAYQFPDRTDRLVLISSGGLGTQVSPALRAATLPSAEWAVAGLARLPGTVVRGVLSALPAFLARQDTRTVADALHGLAGARQRRTFVRTARTVIDRHGQTVSAAPHLTLLGDLPVLLAWGSDDRTIPPDHQRAVARRLPALHTAEITDAGHFPHETAPERLIPHLRAFLAATEPFCYSEAGWRRLVDPSGTRG
ncbi:hydrolase [Asanoa siamensis]|uniref:Hydrolase n=1 Tax=Asanoa siamensis TaxID=926357 RepID=A0ABQ4CYV6_9ACTN|nr:hydrolase [Asanoa siamensis]